MNEDDKIGRDYRKELWISVATAVAGALNSYQKTNPVSWADEAVRGFDKTFPGNDTRHIPQGHGKPL